MVTTEEEDDDDLSDRLLSDSSDDGAFPILVPEVVGIESDEVEDEDGKEGGDWPEIVDGTLAEKVTSLDSSNNGTNRDDVCFGFGLSPIWFSIKLWSISSVLLLKIGECDDE